MKRKSGLLHKILQGIGRLISPFVFRIKAVYILWLPSERWVTHTEDSGLRCATFADEEKIAMLRDRTVSIHNRLNRGSCGVIKEKDGQIVGWLWFNRANPTYEGWLRIQLSNSDSWIFDVFVSPSHRGEGIANQMGDFARKEMARHGITRIVTVTNVLNSSAFRSSDKRRYETARIWYLRLLGLTLVKFPSEWRFGWWSPGRPLQVPINILTDPPST